MNMPHCESECVFAARGYSVKSLFVYANGKDLSVAELLRSGAARMEKLGFPGSNQ